MAPRLSKTTEAIDQLHKADRMRAHAEVLQRLGDPLAAAHERSDAGKLEAAAEDVLKMPEIARPGRPMAAKWASMTTLTPTTGTRAYTCSTPSATRTWRKRKPAWSATSCSWTSAVSNLTRTWRAPSSPAIVSSACWQASSPAYPLHGDAILAAVSDQAPHSRRARATVLA